LIVTGSGAFPIRTIAEIRQGAGNIGGPRFQTQKVVSHSDGDAIKLSEEG
jgi:hypothetical protein